MRWVPLERPLMKGILLTADSDSRIHRFLEDTTTKETVKLWTETLRGFMPLKREKMLRKFGDRLPVLRALDDFVQRISVELEVSRHDVREGIRWLQGKYGFRVNYNQVKDPALRQLIMHACRISKSAPFTRLDIIIPPDCRCT